MVLVMQKYVPIRSSVILLAALSVSACGMVNSLLNRTTDNERPPQVVEGERRRPLMNPPPAKEAPKPASKKKQKPVSGAAPDAPPPAETDKTSAPSPTSSNNQSEPAQFAKLTPASGGQAEPMNEQAQADVMQQLFGVPAAAAAEPPKEPAAAPLPWLAAAAPQPLPVVSDEKTEVSDTSWFSKTLQDVKSRLGLDAKSDIAAEAQPKEDTPYPALSSVPEKPEAFDQVKKEIAETTDALQADHAVAKETKQQLENETANVLPLVESKPENSAMPANTPEPVLLGHASTDMEKPADSAPQDAPLALAPLSAPPADFMQAPVSGAASQTIPLPEKPIEPEIQAATPVPALSPEPATLEVVEQKPAEDKPVVPAPVVDMEKPIVALPWTSETAAVAKEEQPAAPVILADEKPVVEAPVPMEPTPEKMPVVAADAPVVLPWTGANPAPETSEPQPQAAVMPAESAPIESAKPEAEQPAAPVVLMEEPTTAPAPAAIAEKPPQLAPLPQAQVETAPTAQAVAAAPVEAPKEESKPAAALPSPDILKQVRVLPPSRYQSRMQSLQHTLGQ